MVTAKLVSKLLSRLLDLKQSRYISECVVDMQVKIGPLLIRDEGMRFE